MKLANCILINILDPKVNVNPGETITLTFQANDAAKPFKGNAQYFPVKMFQYYSLNLM